MSKTPDPSTRRNPWHIFPPGWKENHWLVPYEGDQAIIHHGHSDSSNHSMCGPMLFCCSKSMQTYIKNFPESAQAKASWGLTEAKHIATWMEAGVNTLYFVFCDPKRMEGLLAGGLAGEQARQTLFREIPLEQFSEQATRLR